MNRVLFTVFLGSLLFLPAAAQNQSSSLITQPIDDTHLLTLRGSVHPLTRGASDLGPVPDSFAAGRMLLLLNRPAERQAALEQFLSGVNTRGSANYHQWLTPEQFGQQFGPSEADLTTASAWLTSHGLNVARISKGRQFIVFSGTAGALRETFHIEIHQYSVDGETHYANAVEAKIPAALAALVKGISPLNDFRAQPMLQVLGQASYQRATNRTTPQWTLPNGSSTVYALAPEDFATQYDVTPLYKAGLNGAGQTIGIINESDIDLSLVQSFQKLFGLPARPPQVVIEGSDPGDLPGVDIEAYLDVEEAGAIAPGANVDLYIANTNGIFTGTAPAMNVIDPLYMAALRAVDDNQASVLSVSFGNCEGFLLQSGNALWSALWQQAAAQGQTVLVSSGDSGSAGCDNATQQWTTEYGPAVNGLASTPWDVAVGGTDFYYSDYAKGGANAASLWNQANDTDNGSLKAPLTEQVWDTAYGLNATGPYVQYRSVSIPAGGGGASGCVNSSENTTGSGLPFICSPATAGLYGYAMPSWQTSSGGPSVHVRLVPDVSLFAAAQVTNFSAYPICAVSGDCATGAGGNSQITLVGGTSASTPAMAAIMALVNQKYGRQGQADFTLYPLASQVPTAFHDITLGSNNMTCVMNSPNCSADTNGDGLYSLQKYSATPGYDLASGLGSVDANVLVNNWNSITFKPSSTTLQITPTTAQVGTQITVTANVNSSSGGASPQGSVTIMMNPSSAYAQPAAVFTLGGGTITGALTDLPGGTYQVWAQYSGDGRFAPSESAPQTVTITPVASTVNLYGFSVPGRTLNPAAPCLLNSNQSVYETATMGGPWLPAPSGTSFGDDSQVVPMAIVNGAWPSFGAGTGNVTFTVDGTPQATVALNNFGYAAWIPPSTFNAGTHAIGATYSGDASYSSATAAPYTAVVPQVAPMFSIAPAANCGPLPGYQTTAVNCSMSAGDTLRVEVQISMANCHIPTGAITVNLGSLSQNVTLVPGGLTTQSLSFVGRPMMSGEAVFQNVPAGTYPLSATYAGDANSLPTDSTAENWMYGPPPDYTIVATAAPAPLLATTTALSVNPPSFDNTLWLNFGMQATVTGPSGSTSPPTGWADFFEDGQQIASAQLSPTGPNAATAVGGADGLQMDVGTSQLKVVYSGDSVYQSSAFSQPYQFTINVGSPDLLLAPQLRQLTVQPGSSATMGFNLGALNAFNGTVALTCTPSSSQITCTISPSTVNLSTRASATLTIKSLAQSSSAARSNPQKSHRWPVAFGALAFGLFFVRRARRNALWRTILLSLCFVASFGAVSCGGGSSSGSNPPPPPTYAAATYSAVVTATANGLAHNAVITVVVP
jgi:Pro-kumamolisin, activation domain/Bacterial Ig-like domain (group 3)